MSHLQHIQQLMAELGPMVEEITLIQQREEREWLIVFDDLTALEMQYDEIGNKLVFSMTVAAVPDESAAEIYRAMLYWNLLYEDTGGMRLAMQGDAEVVLLVDLCHLNLEVHVLASFLENFTRTGLSWREILLAEGDESSDGERSDAAIRV